MKKSFLIILILINFFFLFSCNTSKPSHYLSANERDRITNYYYVTFDTLGGSKIERIKIREKSLLKVPNEPTKEHALFNGWYKDINYEQPYNFGELVTESFTLYARWVLFYRIEFVTNTKYKMDDDYVKEGYNLEFRIPYNEDELKFEGWYLDSEFTIPFDFSSIITKDLILYARWS